MKTMINLKRIIALGTSIASTCLVLSACVGQSSDPLAKYSQLKVSQPTSQTSETQVIAPDVFTDLSTLEVSEVLELKLQGTNEVNNANFLEEQESTLYFKVIPKSQKITKYSVVLTEFMMGSKPLSQRPVIIPTSKPHIFGLKWKAAAGIIPGGQLYVTLQAKILITVTEATDVNLNGLVKSDTLNFIVSRNNSVPKILGRSKLDAGIDEGQSLAFSVDIEDPASASSPRVPEVQITPYIYSNTEAFRADGARYVTMDFSHAVNPEKLTEGANQWRFYFKIIVDQLPLDRDRKGIENPLSPAVNICFHIRAISVIATQSEQQQLCLKARYAAQAPLLKWDEVTVFEVTSANPQVFKFKILSGNDLGQIDLKDPTQQITELKGTKELKCSHEVSDKLSSQVCELSWTPSCVKTKTTQKLSLKVDNKTGNKSKSQTFTKDFTVLPNEEACTKKPTPKTPTKPTSNQNKAKEA